MKCLAPITYYSYSTIFRPHRTRKLARRQNCMSLSSFAFSNSVQPARCKTTMSRIAYDAVRGSIRFFEDHVGDLLSHLCEPHPWCKKVVAIAHNAKAFDAQFILDRAILLKWTPELILNRLKIVSMKIHHIQFLDSITYMPMPLRKLPETFGLQASKSWFPICSTRRQT